MNTSRNWTDIVNSKAFNASSIYDFIYTDKNEKNLKATIKHYVRFMIYRKHLSEIFNFFSSENLVFLPSVDHGLLDKIFRPYISKNYSVCEVVKIIKENYGFISNVNKHLFKKIFTPDGVVLSSICNDEFNLVFRHDGTFRKEGELSISIIEKKSNHRIYSCAFSFMKKENNYAMLIGSVQGPEKRVENVIEKIKKITKELHGLMPKNLVVITSTMIARLYGVHEYYGIKTCSHVYQSSRYKINHSRVLFDYDALWQEFNGIEYDNSFYRIYDYQRKSLESVSSKKRSEYRKRFNLLDELDARVIALNNQDKYI